MEQFGEFCQELDAHLCKQTNQYTTYERNWIYVDDTNGGNNIYSSNYVYFNKVNIKSSTANELYHLGEAMIGMRWQETLTIAGGIFRGATRNSINVGAVDASNALSGTAPSQVYSLNATSVSATQTATGNEIYYKGLQNFVDNVSLDLGSQQVLRNTPFNNILNDLELKKLKTDEYDKAADRLNYLCEPTDFSYITSLSATGSTMIGGRTLFKPTEQKQKRENDYLGGFTYTSGTSAAPIISNIYDLVGNQNLHRVKKTLVSVSDTQLVYSCYALVPLAHIHNVFSKMPSVLNIDGFSIELQMNIGENNSTTVTFGNSAAPTALGQVKEFLPVDYNTIQTTGQVCPFLFGKCGWDTSDPTLDIIATPSAAANFTISLTTQINGSPSEKLRLYIPYTKHPNLSSLTSSPVARILYKDTYYDRLLGVAAQSSVSRKFNFDVKRPRNLFIFPYITSSKRGLAELTSPLFNAPCEVSPTWLDDLQVQINSQPIFRQPLKYKWQHFENYEMFVGDERDANAERSEDKCGMVTFDMYQRTHGVIVVDLKTALNVEFDNQVKTIEVEFVNRSNVTMDYLLVISSQNEIGLDRLACQVTKLA